MIYSSFTTDWSEEEIGLRAATFGPSQLIQASAVRMAWPNANNRNDVPLSNDYSSRQKTYVVSPRQSSPRLLDVFSKVVN